MSEKALKVDVIFTKLDLETFRQCTNKDVFVKHYIETCQDKCVNSRSIIYGLKNIMI